MTSYQLMSQKTALITGIAGQDGAYLAAFLRGKGYAVHGLVRWDSFADPLDGVARLDALGLVNDDVRLHTGDMTDAQYMTRLIKEVQPDEIYNLAAVSHVAVSFDIPANVFDINTKGTLAILEAIRLLEMEGKTKLYQASSSEMFGSAPAPQSEDTPMHPCSPYGIAKLAAFWLVKNYREAHGIFATNGILFNHESPSRPEGFVTRKITKAVAALELGRVEPLALGNLDSMRDWGHARDYTRGMWSMMQHGTADDFVLATGQARSVRDFVTRAFAHIGIMLRWQGQGMDETACDVKTGRIMVRVDPQFFRPKDVTHLLGDAAKAKRLLNWAPQILFDDLVSEMVNADRILLRHARDPAAADEYNTQQRRA